MNTFIPLDLYYPLYINLCFFLVLFTLLHSKVLEVNDSMNIMFINFTGYALVTFLVLYMGQRPIHITFGDTVNYNVAYKAYQFGAEIPENEADYGWHLFMKLSSQIISIHTFFTICAFVYIYPLFKISKFFFKEYWYYAFIMFVVSYSFWTYGVNGMRNGAATSLFLWGVSCHRNKVLMGVLFLCAIFFHKTLFLPILAFLLTYLYNDPKFYFKGWLLCIPLSLALGSLWITLFASIGFADDRLAGYLTSQAAEGTFSRTGFRWDFLFHSAFAVFAGWYFVLKRGFEDKMYFQLLNTYLICNGFWILVINANYSNRFAYLSWFMMGIIIIYPMLKKQFFEDQYFMIAKVMLVYFMFTYSMYYLYS